MSGVPDRWHAEVTLVLRHLRINQPRARAAAAVARRPGTRTSVGALPRIESTTSEGTHWARTRVPVPVCQHQENAVLVARRPPHQVAHRNTYSYISLSLSPTLLAVCLLSREVARVRRRVGGPGPVATGARLGVACALNERARGGEEADLIEHGLVVSSWRRGRFCLCRWGMEGGVMKVMAVMGWGGGVMAVVAAMGGPGCEGCGVGVPSHEVPSDLFVGRHLSTKETGLPKVHFLVRVITVVKVREHAARPNLHRQDGAADTACVAVAGGHVR